MPKMKSKRCAAKRFSFTATGKVKYKKMNLRHILTKNEIFVMVVLFQRLIQPKSASSFCPTVNIFSGELRCPEL